MSEREGPASDRFRHAEAGCVLQQGDGSGWSTVYRVGAPSQAGGRRPVSEWEIAAATEEG